MACGFFCRSTFLRKPSVFYTGLLRAGYIAALQTNRLLNGTAAGFIASALRAFKI
jgi:hypothetical protein